MQEETASLRAAQKSGSSADSYKTPPPRVSAPTPTRSTAPEPKRPPVPPRSLCPSSPNKPPETEGAKLARLRRLCEVKPSGRCSVPTEVHERWLKGGKSEREAMVEEFERANWSKDPVHVKI